MCRRWTRDRIFCIFLAALRCPGCNWFVFKNFLNKWAWICASSPMSERSDFRGSNNSCKMLSENPPRQISRAATRKNEMYAVCFVTFFNIFLRLRAKINSDLASLSNLFNFVSNQLGSLISYGALPCLRLHSWSNFFDFCAHLVKQIASQLINTRQCLHSIGTRFNSGEETWLQFLVGEHGKG